MAINYVINGVHFSTQTALIKKTQEILYKKPLRQKLDDEDFKFMLDFLKKIHPCSKEKIGCGVDYFYTDTGPKGTRCFHIQRTDGSHVHFSFRKYFKK